MSSQTSAPAAATTEPITRMRGHLETTGDVRRALANTIKAVMNGQIKAADAIVIVKGCEQMNASLYAEIKYMTMLVATGQQPAALGDLPMFGRKGIEEEDS